MKRKIKLNFMKKNQVVVAVTGLMLIAAGYMNYSNNEQSNSIGSIGIAEIGDAKLASANVSKKNDIQDEVESNILDSKSNEEDKNNIIEKRK